MVPNLILNYYNLMSDFSTVPRTHNANATYFESIVIVPRKISHHLNGISFTIIAERIQNDRRNGTSKLNIVEEWTILDDALNDGALNQSAGYTFYINTNSTVVAETVAVAYIEGGLGHAPFG